MATAFGTVTPATATAQPAEPPATPTITMIPERPALTGVTPFTDNPAIVDARPQGIEAWSRLPDPDAVAVQFTTGTPECYGVHAEVQETADIVAIKLRSGTVPEAVGRACIAIGVIGSMPVKLGAPVGSRAVVSIT
ncbi:hypothetical protein E4P42_08380 [Mycobacterium sp. PS03-16]|nr:hypothetical protein E4P42_08380 [Mycobacterium sp. PS03-16]